MTQSCTTNFSFSQTQNIEHTKRLQQIPNKSAHSVQTLLLSDDHNCTEACNTIQNTYHTDIIDISYILLNSHSHTQYQWILGFSFVVLCLFFLLLLLLFFHFVFFEFLLLFFIVVVHFQFNADSQ